MPFFTILVSRPPLLQLILITVVGHIALTGARVTTSLYALSLHASAFRVGTLIALFALLPMLFAVGIGRLVDRVGIARPILVGGVVMTLGCTLPALVPGLAVLYPAVALIGIGFTGLHVATLHAVGATSTEANRASRFSWLGTGYSVSSFSGPVLAGLVIDHLQQGRGYAAAFAVSALFPIVAMAMSACAPVARLKLAAGTPHQGGSALHLLRDRPLRNIYAVGVLLGGAWDLFMFAIPIQSAQMGLSASSTGLILGAFASATFVVRLGMQWIARVLGPWQIITLALCVAVLCYGALPLLHSAPSLTMLSVLLGLALGSSQPNMLALLHRCAPPGRAGEAIGIRVTISNASQVVLPLAFGAAGATLGLFAVFWCTGALIATGVPLAWRQARRAATLMEATDEP